MSIPQEIRNDDILQISHFSKQQRDAFSKKTPFEYFLEADKVFAEYKYPCTLAILSEGVLTEPQWAEYIKRNINRYKIELHGSSHLKYKKMSKEEGLFDLRKAKEIIEKAFDGKITTWYVPFGRSNLPIWGQEVCDELGIKFDIPVMKCLPYFWNKEPKRGQINFHYWDLHQTKQIENIIKIIKEEL